MFKRMLLAIMVLLAASMSLTAFAAEPGIKGSYRTVEGKGFKYDGKTVEIVEFMSFFCGGCYMFEKQVPIIKGNFPKKIKWKIIPVNWGESSPKPAEAYFLALDAGKGEEMKKAIFDAQFVQKKNIGSVEVLESIAADLGLGFDFSRRLRAGEKAAEVKKGMDMAREYRVEGTPTVVIAGNIMATPRESGQDLEQMRKNVITIVNSIIRK